MANVTKTGVILLLKWQAFRCIADVAILTKSKWKHAGAFLFAFLLTGSGLFASDASLEAVLSDARKVTSLDVNWHAFEIEGSHTGAFFSKGSILLVSNRSITDAKAGMIIVFRTAEHGCVAQKADWIEGRSIRTKGYINGTKNIAWVTESNFVGIAFGVFPVLAEDRESRTEQANALPKVIYGFL